MDGTRRNLFDGHGPNIDLHLEAHRREERGIYRLDGRNGEEDDGSTGPPRAETRSKS